MKEFELIKYHLTY